MSITNMEATISIDRFWQFLFASKSKVEFTPRDIAFAMKNSVIRADRRES